MPGGSAAIFQFESDVGSFSILPKEGKLHYQLSGEAGTFDKAEIRGLEHGTCPRHRRGARAPEPWPDSRGAFPGRLALDNRLG